MILLSVTLEKCSGCAIMKNGKILYSSSEERFSRVKSDSSFPKKSIFNGLKILGLKSADIDLVLISGVELSLYAPLFNLYSSLSVEDQINNMKEYWEPKLLHGKNISFEYVLRKKIEKNKFPFKTKHASVFEILNSSYKFKKYKKDNKKPFQSPRDVNKVSIFYKKVISDLLKIDLKKIIHVDHHTCHAAYALYASPIRDPKTIVVTADAWGDSLSGTISIYSKKDNKIKRVKKYFHKDFQLGRIYRFTTIFLKMLGDSHEYKVMGLAPYYKGLKIDSVKKIYLKMQKIKNGKFIFNKKVKNIYNFLERNLSNYRFDHIASGLQNFTEELLKKWFEYIVKKYRYTSIVYSGGTSMNVKANMVVSKIKNIKKFYVCGSGTDDTLPMGACYHYSSQHGLKTLPLDNMYLGDNANYVNSDLKVFKHYRIKKVKSLNEILNSLLKNKIVATCRGRAEMGQRALGNRSILADPRDEETVKKINEAIKQRDFWMPFAPVILDKYQSLLIKNPKKIKSPFMTVAFETTEFGKKNIPAAIHKSDKTARAQILERRQNPDLWDLINIFYKKTGVPALLNTSFNLHGFPIVNSIFDAKKVLDRSELKVLWTNHHLIEKK